VSSSDRPALVTDGTSCLAPALADALSVGVVGLHLALDGVEVPEADVDPVAFAQRLVEAPGTVTTSSPAPGAFLAAFDRAAAAGARRVLCLACGSNVSGTASAARVAAGLAGVPVEVVDTGTVGGGLLLVVLAVARALTDGASYEEARALTSEVTGRVSSTWSSATPERLRASGRLRGDLPATGVPVLALEGEVRVLGRAWDVGESSALQAAVVRAAAAARPTPVTVGASDDPAAADALAAALDGALGITVLDRYVVAPVVTAHVGASSFGASYLAPLARAAAAG